MRSYRKKVKREERPREEWTAIPVPDSGIPPEIIARAWDRIEKNTWTPSRNSNRTWELSGGIAVCGHCGSRLKTHITSNAAKTKYFYYVCPKRTSNRDNGTCPNTKHYRAEALELLVRDNLLDTLQEETWADIVDKTYNRRMEDLRKMHRFDPSKTRERLLKRIDSLEAKMTRLVDLFTDGDISKETYREKKSSRNRSQGCATSRPRSMTSIPRWTGWRIFGPPCSPWRIPSVGITSSSEMLTRTLWLITVYPTGPRKRRHGVGWISTVRRGCE